MLELKIQLFAEEDDPVEKNYLEQIDQLKTKMDNEMISKEEYDKLFKEHKKLTEEFINRRPQPKKEEVTIRDIKEIAKELKAIDSNDITNREYVKKSLEYRNAHIHTYGTDPFTDFGKNGPSEPTAETIKLAEGLQHMVDESKNAFEFRMLYQQMVKDDPRLLAKLGSKR